MRVMKQRTVFSWEAIHSIQDAYQATWVCETCVKTVDGEWSNFPVAIFYQSNPTGNYNHHFGMYYRNSFVICSVPSALEPFEAVSLDGEHFYYSRFRHDFYSFPGGGFVDGGRDYTRFGGLDISKFQIARCQIVKDEIKVLEVVDPKWKEKVD